MIKDITNFSKFLTLIMLLMLGLSVRAADTIPPVIDLKTDDTIYVQIASIFSETNPTITDNQSDINSISVVVTRGFSGYVNSSQRGWYSVTYEATDSNGNKASKTRYAKVDDFIAPLIYLNTNDTVYHKINTPYNSVAASVSDNYYPSNQVSLVKLSGNVNPNVAGIYYEVLEAVDASGNTTRKTRVVIVEARLSIKDLNSSTLIIYPNPASSGFMLSIPEGTGKFSLQILSMDGKVVFESNTINHNAFIETSNYETGVYTVLVKEKQKTSTLRLLIQH